MNINVVSTDVVRGGNVRMVVRWAAASLLDMEKRFRRIMGYQQLWILEAHLDEAANDKKVARKGKAA